MNLEIKKSHARAAYKNGDKDDKAFLENLFGKEVFNEKVTDRVKTFEDACNELGISANEIESMKVNIQAILGDEKSIKAYVKLIIITRALNEGWIPDWTNKSQYKYQPWFEYASASGWVSDDSDVWRSNSNVGSRLVFETREKAEYATKQFKDIYNEFFNL